MKRKLNKLIQIIQMVTEIKKRKINVTTSQRDNIILQAILETTKKDLEREV